MVSFFISIIAQLILWFSSRFGNPWVPAGSGVNTYGLPLLGVWFWSVLRKPWIGWNGLPAKIERVIIYLSWELDSWLIGQDQIVLGYVSPESRGLVSSCEIMLPQSWPNPWRIPLCCCLYRVGKRHGEHGGGTARGDTASSSHQDEYFLKVFVGLIPCWIVRCALVRLTSSFS